MSKEDFDKHPKWYCPFCYKPLENKDVLRCVNCGAQILDEAEYFKRKRKK